MISLDFKYASARNFLCYGPEGIELDFRNYGNIVLIRGENLDVQNEEERIASNGVGKSSLPEILVYALFGKTIKQPKKITHKNVINNKIGKDLCVEVHWNNFKVIRTRSPDTLRLWENDVEISLGGIPATQELLESKIGMTYQTFVNVFISTDNNAGAFLECDAKNKREFVENLLMLDKYRCYGDAAKNVRKDYNDTIKTISQNYDYLLNEVKNCQNRITDYEDQERKWRDEKNAELNGLLAKLQNKTEELKQSDAGVALDKYNKAQEEITRLNNENADLEGKKNKVAEILGGVNAKLAEQRDSRSKLNSIITYSQEEIKASNKTISQFQTELMELETNTGKACQYCKGIVKKENVQLYSDQINEKINKTKENLETTTANLKKAQDELLIVDQAIEKLIQGVGVANQKTTEVNFVLQNNRKLLTELAKIQRPEPGALELLLESQLTDIKNNIELKKVEITNPSPFEKLIKTAREEYIAKEREASSKYVELKEAEALIPYYEFWVKAFGDTGIRRFVIDGIIPALNAHCNYWLQHLIDGRIQIHFDNELEETIERNPKDGDPFVYAAMSGGERRRLCLAVCNAFAHIMMLSSGRTTSCIFLDEVTTNIDPIGVVGVYNMIMEMAKDRQVFVTTHDQGLLDMLEGCEVIKLIKKDGFTTLAKDDKNPTP